MSWVRGPVGSSLGGKDPTGRLSLAFSLGQNSKHVVVACGGVVDEDQCPRVGGRESARREVEAAALALATNAPDARGPTVGPVERDETALECEARDAELGRPAIEDAAA